MLTLEEYTPINIAVVKSIWEREYNVPNQRWESIESALEIINNDKLPNTLRLFNLNHLPFCIVEIMESIGVVEDEPDEDDDGEIADLPF